MKKIKNHQEKYYQKLKAVKFTAVLLIPVTAILFVLELTGISEKIYQDCAAVFGFEEFSQKADSDPLSVHFIDVGTGDSILICCEGKNILIDTGSPSLNGKTTQYLKHKNIQKIDIFIATHMDSDHIGDFKSIAENFIIHEIWFSQESINPENKQSKYEKALLNIIKENQVNIFYPEAKTYNFAQFSIDVFPPSKKYEEENDNSLVIKLNYQEISFLFTGDAGFSAEEDLIQSGRNIQSDILKVGHHGSKTATSEKFLNAVSPKYAVISAGEDNPYLPNKEVVQRLKNKNIEILRTDFEGCVIIAWDSKNIHIFSEKYE